MVKILKLFGFIILFFLALSYVTPKVNFYYLLEKKLQKQKIILSDEQIKDKGFTLNIKNTKVFYDSIESAKVEKINITTLFFFNYISIKNVKLSGIASSFIPINIKNIDVSYSIFNPINISISASGDFGESTGSFNLLDNNLNISINPSKLTLTKYKKTLKYLEKNQDGAYSYDTTFN